MIRIIASSALLLMSTFHAFAVPHILVDLDNGHVLSHKQAFDPWHPASLTKLMTALVVFRAIDAGEIAPTDTVMVSKNARRQPPSRMGYAVGTTLTVEDALKLLIVKSANDISVALAESLAGSVPRFAERMNAEASRIGMTSSRFANPHGLHDPRQVITARDFAILLRVLHQNYPRYSDWFKAPGLLAEKLNKKKKKIQRVYYSYNLLLERYRGADGFKTGFVCASGYNFAGSASRGGRRIAAVVLGRDSQTSRVVDAAKLITQGFELPVTDGVPLMELKAPADVRTSPRNMRSVLCTPEARAKRYEPGAGQAVIKSPWLSKREKQKIVLTSSILGRVSSRPVTIPTPRPDYKKPEPIDGALIQASRSVPIPVFRPDTVFN